MSTLFLPIIVSFFSIAFAIFLIFWLKKLPQGTQKMEEISRGIQEGAASYLKRQFKTILVIAAAIFLVLWLFLGFETGIGFLLGASFSWSAGFIGMLVSTRTNVKVARAAKNGLNSALNISFKGGSVTGFLVVGLGLLCVSLFWFLTKDLKALAGLGFGASLISVFARLGGGIYTKAADVGADLVGKVEKGIPEDDPRNPAVIADQVGDNVGDCAGMAADLFETYVVTLIGAIILAALIFKNSLSAIFLPLILSSVSILVSIVATFFVRLGKSKSIIKGFYKGLIAAALLAGLGFLFPIFYFAPKFSASPIRIYLAAILGLLIDFGLFFLTDYFTSKKYKPVRSIASASSSGHATNIITGLAIGMVSTFPPAFLISAGILLSFWLAGLYGIAICAVSMLSLTGIIIALDSYGPITDNAAGIAEMADEGEEIRKNTDALDAVGNTTKAVTKAVAIGSAALAALVLFSSYQQEILSYGKKFQFLLSKPEVLVGLFSGGVLSYLFASLAMSAVGKTASSVVEEVRRQFREIKGLMIGEAKPDYSQAVDIVTRASLKQMLLPALLPIIFPVAIGFLLGPEALGGLLIGSIVTGFFIAVSMTTGGAAWDNAKKYIEEGNLGGKGSSAHQAAVTGDTVGDSYKDAAGPAINPMIKVLNIVALLIVSFLI